MNFMFLANAINHEPHEIYERRIKNIRDIIQCFFVYFVFFVVSYYSKLFLFNRNGRGKMDQEKAEKIILRDESYAVQGAIFEVYREMGCGFLEAVYQECLCKEFQNCSIPFKSKVDLSLSYKGHRLDQTYQADFICFDQIIIELKAIKEVTDIHRAQVINYLKATGLRLGLLVNFGHYPRATIERIIL